MDLLNALEPHRKVMIYVLRDIIDSLFLFIQITFECLVEQT